MVVVGWEGLNFWFRFGFAAAHVYFYFFLCFAGKLITQYSPRSSRPENWKWMVLAKVFYERFKRGLTGSVG